MTKGLLSVLLLLVATSTSFAQEKTIKDYWEETKLNTNVFKHMINNENCYQTEEQYLACVESVQAMAKEQFEGATLVTTTYLKENLYDVEQIINKQWLGVKLVKLKDLQRSKSKVDSWVSIKKQKDRINHSFYVYYKVGRKLDFQVLVDFFVPLINSAPYAKAKIANIINAYNSVIFDPHTYITPLKLYEDRAKSSEQKFMGIGIMYETLEGKLYIKKVIPGGPADKAGIKPRDLVTELNDISTGRLFQTEISSKIRGPEGTVIELTIERGKSTFKTKVTRGVVVLPNVVAKKFGDYGYIQLDSFVDEKGCSTIEENIKKFHAENVKGLIFDLRGNGGGAVSQASCIIGLFVGKLKVAYKEKGLGPNDNFEETRTQQDQVTDLPLVTLIDGNSASASELVANALQDYKRSWVLGERSFGKGTVQRGLGFMLGEDDMPQAGFPMLSYVSGILFFQTQSKFYSPSGYTNQLATVVPDFEVPTFENATDEDRFYLREADLYSNAIKTDNPPRSTLRPQEVGKLKTCVEPKMKNNKNLFEEDFQVTYAVELLKCEAHQ